LTVRKVYYVKFAYTNPNDTNLAKLMSQPVLSIKKPLKV